MSCKPALAIPRSVSRPLGSQCMRMATVITARGVSVRTSGMRCSTNGERPVAARSARPMGVTRIARSTGPDGSAGRPRGANMAPCSVTRL